MIIFFLGTSKSAMSEEEDEDIAQPSEKQAEQKPAKEENLVMHELKPDVVEQKENKKLEKEESHKHKEGRIKKKKRSHHHHHHRHGKHSKNDKDPSSHKSKSSKHGKKKHGRDGKRSKDKKKKNKHLRETEVAPILTRSLSQESLESSNRSRSASPLPSIHSPTPSPTPEKSEQLPDPDFFKDKYDKIKERRRTATKDAWDSLFESKAKTSEKTKQNTNAQEKVKNKKLRETIEKLKAKNEKYKDSSLFNTLLPSSSNSNIDKNSDSNLTQESSIKGDDGDSSDDNFEPPEQKDKKSKDSKTLKKINSNKNESASEALEQAVKDISKLLDDAPKLSNLSSPCDSPSQTISTEDQDNSRLDDEPSQTEKVVLGKRKRMTSKEPKVIKRREIQRTIDRLQPGKSKGNLLTNISVTQKVEEAVPHGSSTKTREINKIGESSPKLSLGSVLPTVDFTLGNDHNFANKDESNHLKVVELENESETKADSENKPVVENVNIELDENKKVDNNVEPKPTPCQSKALPNLSAWFKAFGARKNTLSTVSIKKKVEERDNEEKSTEAIPPTDLKSLSPKTNTKYDSPTDEISPNPEGGESPLTNVHNTPRHRRTSTGSSISERSSFSQDLDSPRHQMSHTSPLLRSPASPRTEEFQKITYPIINGTVRAGFYQDTASMKSSPEKSCSPREGPQSPYSPYSPYSPHVYVSNVMGSSTPNYFYDHSKSPVPTYGQSQPHAYYDTAKTPILNKSRIHDEYNPSGPENHNQYRNNITSMPSPYNYTQHSPYAPMQLSPMHKTPISPAPTESKNVLFPVKKRTYTENDMTLSHKKINEEKLTEVHKQTKEYSKTEPSMRSMNSLSCNSVDDISARLTEKAKLEKSNQTRDKSSMDYDNRQHVVETQDNNVCYNNNDQPIEMKKAISPNSSKLANVTRITKDNIDMVNMGYSNNDIERRSNGDVNDLEHIASREVPSKPLSMSQTKGYEVEAVAMNLGMNSQQPQKSFNRNNVTTILSSDKTNIGVCFTPNLAEYEGLSIDSQNVGNFSLTDIELVNKKLFPNNPTQSGSGIDYGNWKLNNQLKKQNRPCDYSNSYVSNTNDKLKSDIITSMNSTSHTKNVHQQQYHNYNSTRSNMQRVQELPNLPSELRIPNPRGLLKSDTISTQIDNNGVSKSVESSIKTQKSEQLIQNHPLVNSLPYKTSYTNHSTLQLDGLRNLQNIPQMLERYSNDERYLSSFATGTGSLYHDKSFQMSQIFNKSSASDVHPVTTSSGIYSQPSTIIKDTNSYKSSINLHGSQHDAKVKSKRKRTTDTKQSQIMPSQSFHNSSCTTDVLSSVKSSMVPGSAFNFGTPPNMTLGGGFYGDNAGFSIADFHNSTANQLMAANYVASAVAHQRNNTASNVEKLVKPAHQNSSHATTSSFPFMSHSQVRAGYPFVGADPSSPLYQQYLQRQQEEILRQTGAQIMGLYPPGYPAPLASRQPYDTINRPSWI